MAVDFAARRKQAEDEGLISSGDYLKFKEGPNRFRLMSECLPHPGSYKGTKSFKWLCYVVDRRDGKVKPFFMPHTVYKQIEALQLSEDYTFSEVPMPYDITVNADGAGTKEVKYTVIPAKKEVPVTTAERMELSKAKPIEELQKALKDKQAKNGSDAHDSPPGDTSFDPAELEGHFEED